MSTRYPIVLSSLLIASLALSASAQSIDDQNRPRPLDSSSSQLNEPARPLTPSEASAQAKKLFKAGQKYGEAGLFSQAADLFQQAVRLKPDYVEAYASLGHAYMDLKQWPQAIEALEQALTINPKHKESRERLAAARTALEAEGNKVGNPGPGLNAGRTSLPTKKVLDEESLTKTYRIGPGDVLDIKFGESPSVPDGSTVSNAGLLEHPELVQPVPVKGLTVDEIADRVSDVRKSAARTTVTVTVRDYVSHRIMVSGLVKDPGMKILRREAIPLSVVLADAQRMPEAAIAKIARNETNEVLTVELSNDAEMGLLIRPGDVITLETAPAQFFYVGGEVKLPGERSFRRGLTLTQAILSAGGLIGKAKEARLGRDDGKGFVVTTPYKLKDIESGKIPDPLIQPGDRITVLK